MQLISIKELSKRQNISVSQLRKLIKSGLPHFRVKKKILIDEPEFVEWFQKQFRVADAAQNKDFEDKIDQILNQFKSTR